MDENEIRAAFINVPGFNYYDGWTEDQKQLFRDFVNAVHDNNLDIYKVGNDNEVRIGSKTPGAVRGRALAFLYFTQQRPRFGWGAPPYNIIDLEQQHIECFNAWLKNPNLVLENTAYNNGIYPGGHQGRLPINYQVLGIPGPNHITD